MRKPLNIETKMRTTNGKISIFCSVSSIFTLLLMCVKFILIPFTKKIVIIYFRYKS